LYSKGKAGLYLSKIGFIRLKAFETGSPGFMPGYDSQLFRIAQFGSPIFIDTSILSFFRKPVFPIRRTPPALLA
jgi:hypothetical protein